MASTTTFGEFPGVQVTTVGGAITGVAVGREQKLIIVGVGDPSNGSASVNDATQIDTRVDADRKFGSDSELADNMRDARSNGANVDYLYGVMLDVTSASGETISGGSGTLANAPLVEDTDVISVTNTTPSDDEAPVFKYDSPPSTSDLSSGEVAINPFTGEVDAGDSDDYQFDYNYPDWSSGLDEAESVIESEESGVIAALSESEDIASDLSGRVNDLREEYKMAVGVQTAQPNDNSGDGTPAYDTQNYSDNIDNDAEFLHAPGRKDGSTHVVTGAVGGRMAGNDLDESIYHQELDVGDLDQHFTNSDLDNVRDEQVIPLDQPRLGSDVVIDDNISTSTEEDWERDYWKRRIVDQVVLIAKAVGDSILGRINDGRTRSTVETQIETELRSLADDRLIEGGEGDGWFVEAYEVDSTTVGIDIGVTPFGIAKRVETTITIDT